MTDLNLIIVGSLDPVDGAALYPAPGESSPWHSQGVMPNAIVVTAAAIPDPWWQKHQALFTQWLEVIPCLAVSTSRPVGLPFRASWFSTADNNTGVFHRTLSGLESVDFVFGQTLDRSTAPQPGTVQIQFIENQGPGDRSPGHSMPGLHPFLINPGLPEDPMSIHWIQIGPDGRLQWWSQLNLSANDQPISLNRSLEIGSSAVTDGSAESPMAIPSTRHDPLDSIIQTLGRQGPMGTEAILRQALDGDLAPLNIRGLS